MTTSTGDLRKRLTVTEASIVEAERHIEVLKSTRTQLLRELALVATFPVLTLPTEITQEIFIRCGPWIVSPFRPKDSEDKTDEWTTPTPLNLWICRQWRDITLSTPELWSTLSLFFDSVPAVLWKTEEVEACVHRWLERSGNLPLSLSFTRMTDDDLIECSFPPDRMGGIVRRYASRIQHLELEMSPNDVDHMGLDSIYLPLLERAKFARVYNDEGEPDSVKIFGRAPKLHSLWFQRPAVFDSYSLPPARLTTFDGGICSMQLFTFPNLTTVRCWVAESLDPLPVSPIHHSRLETLGFVEYHYSRGSGDILLHLSLPALRTLRIEHLHDTTYPSLLPFLARSAPPLTTLVISGENPEFSNCHECISAVAATLENLELDAPTKQIRNLILRTGAASSSWRQDDPTISPPLPKLKSLGFLQPSYDGIRRDLPALNYGLLASFLQARSQGGEAWVKLESFRLIWDFFPPTWDTHPLIRLSQEGVVNIYIGTEWRNYLKWVPARDSEEWRERLSREAY
ncbi:hypothetical protein B0H16DRAFT_1562352 [Mycena metata]|uniref:F-box domain-containing protein n=1 Tax=Mycena metata TaxID=1033252 RepID=A0AAD7IJ40_9AGAR|nr:hypothetical protein B0H16DRAFT_1562352 [Mycena metata]